MIEYNKILNEALIYISDGRAFEAVALVRKSKLTEVQKKTILLSCYKHQDNIKNEAKELKVIIKENKKTTIVRRFEMSDERLNKILKAIKEDSKNRN